VRQRINTLIDRVWAMGYRDARLSLAIIMTTCGTGFRSAKPRYVAPPGNQMDNCSEMPGTQRDVN